MRYIRDRLARTSNDQKSQKSEKISIFFKTPNPLKSLNLSLSLSSITLTFGRAATQLFCTSDDKGGRETKNQKEEFMPYLCDMANKPNAVLKQDWGELLYEYVAAISSRETAEEDRQFGVFAKILRDGKINVFEMVNGPGRGLGLPQREGLGLPHPRWTEMGGREELTRDNYKTIEENDVITKEEFFNAMKRFCKDGPKVIETAKKEDPGKVEIPASVKPEGGVGIQRISGRQYIIREENVYKSGTEYLAEVQAEEGFHIFDYKREWNSYHETHTETTMHRFCPVGKNACDVYDLSLGPHSANIFKKYFPNGIENRLKQYLDEKASQITAENSYVREDEEKFGATFESGSVLYIDPTHLRFCRADQEPGHCFIEFEAVDGLKKSPGEWPIVRRIRQVKNAALARMARPSGDTIADATPEREAVAKAK